MGTVEAVVAGERAAVSKLPRVAVEVVVGPGGLATTFSSLGLSV